MAMREVKAADQFKFVNQGATLKGILVSIEPKKVQGKNVNEYLFDLQDGGRATCLGLADLEKKIQSTHLGHRMEITFESKLKLPNQPAANSDMKIFKVMVDDEITPGYEHLQAA
jgi:hypothetical protein